VVDNHREGVERCVVLGGDEKSTVCNKRDVDGDVLLRGEEHGAKRERRECLDEEDHSVVPRDSDEVTIGRHGGDEQMLW
jgi:hypothetical protein